MPLYNHLVICSSPSPPFPTGSRPSLSSLAHPDPCYQYYPVGGPIKTKSIEDSSKEKMETS